MNITVKRQTGLGGSAMGLAVYINGEKVGHLDNDETATYTISQESVELKVGQGWLKSKPIQVSAGQTAVAKFSMLGSLFATLQTLIPGFPIKSFYLELEP